MWDRHGKYETSEYHAWHNMIQRCNNPRNPGWKYYGGRGIKVYSQWVHNFPLFLKDMGLKPSPELTLERIDNERGYEPGNVKWATRLDQSLNQRRNGSYDSLDLRLKKAEKTATEAQNRAARMKKKAQKLAKGVEQMQTSEELLRKQIMDATKFMLVLADSIQELKEVPSGHLYAAVMGKMSLSTYESFLDTLIKTKLIRRSNGHLLTWIGPEKKIAPTVER